MKKVVLDQSIMQKGKAATASSKMLENFIAPFDAAVVTSAEDNGYTIVSRVDMDEFSIAGVSEKSPGGIPGAVEAVVNGSADLALCNDVFGVCRRYAAERGVFYIRPTYGTVSRFGLIPAASSMDQIGVVCKNPADGFKLLECISGKDERDGAMLPDKSYSYGKSDRKLKAFTPIKRENMLDFAGKFDTVNGELPYFDLYKQVMYILSCAEISANLSRYDGIKFGFRAEGYKSLNELYLRSRTEGLGLNAKLASIMGAAVLSQDRYVEVYEKAMKLRRLIKESLKFNEYDIIALPVKIGENPYDNLAVNALPALAGLPCVSFDYKGHGIQIIADSRGENSLITALEVAGA